MLRVYFQIFKKKAVPFYKQTHIYTYIYIYIYIYVCVCVCKEDRFIIESILCTSITVWFSSATKSIYVYNIYYNKFLICVNNTYLVN